MGVEEGLLRRWANPSLDEGFRANGWAWAVIGEEAALEVRAADSIAKLGAAPVHG